MPESQVEDLLGSGTNSNETPSNSTNNSDQTQSKVRLSSGEELTPDQLAQKYESLHSDYTRKTQKLAQLEKAPADQVQTDGKDAALVAEFRRLGFVSQQEMSDELDRRGGEIETRASQRSVAANRLSTALDDLSTEHPFVDKKKVLEVVASNPNLNMTIEGIAHALYPQEFAKEEAKKLTPGTGSVLPVTENAGAGITSTSNAPGKPTYRFGDGSAMRAAMELLNKGK